MPGFRPDSATDGGVRRNAVDNESHKPANRVSYNEDPSHIRDFQILYLSPDSDLVISNRFGQLERLLTDSAGKTGSTPTGSRTVRVTAHIELGTVLVSTQNGTAGTVRNRVDDLLLRDHPLLLGCDTEPAVSPDGRRIAITSCRSGDPDLWLVDLDGRNLVQLTNRTGYEGGASFSADGAKLVVHAHYPWGRDELQKYTSRKRFDDSLLHLRLL